MKASLVKSRLEKLIKAHFPVLLVGPAGVGKSNLVAAAALAAGFAFIIDHPITADQTDGKGLPAIVDGRAEFLPFGHLRQLVEAKVPTVFFIDDFGQAAISVQAAYFQLILAREINGNKVSPFVSFVAATNRREDKAGVSNFLDPLKSRFHTILNLDPSVEDWSEWALANDVPPELVAFVRFAPKSFLEPGAPTNDIVNRPSPRTVTNLGDLWKIGIDDLETLSGATGAGFAAEFLGFVKIFRSLPSIDGILLDPNKAEIPKEASALYAVATALPLRASDANVGRVITYLDRLPEEFSVLGVRDTIRKVPAATKTPEFVKWAVKHQDVLV